AEIGQGALPVLQNLLGIGTDVIGMFNHLDAVTGGAAGTVATVGTVAAIAGGALSLLAGQAIKARNAWASLPGKMQGVVGAIGAVGVALTALDVLVQKNRSDARSWLERRIGEFDTTKLQDVQRAIQETSDELDKLEEHEGKGKFAEFGSVKLFATSGDRE